MFLPLACVLCAAVALALGSAWAVTATLGIAFMTIGTTMGLHPGLVAGMIISGAYCGDKFSLLSDSTHLAAGSAQTGLFDHVKAMTTTTLPCLIISLVIYSILSIKGTVDYNSEVSDNLSQAIVEHYNYMGPILLLPVLTIVIVAFFKVPAVPSIMIITFVGCIFAMIFQGASFSDCLTMMHHGYTAETGNELCDALLNRGGMNSMLKTCSLAIMAVGFGGILQKIGAVESLLGNMIKNVKNPLQLVVVTILTSIFCIVAMCDQYLGLIIPAGMYKDKFDSMGLSRNMLSRTLEDGGTLWSPLIPWSSCGVYHSGILGVSTFEYIPYAFMNLINPIYAILSASIGANLLYADGTYTNFLGKRKQGHVAEAPAEAKRKAMEALGSMESVKSGKAATIESGKETTIEPAE
jgi:NhaC family Na+:H+ antiporter